MSERNYLNVAATLPLHVTDEPERVARFVRERGGSLTVLPHSHYLHKTDKAMARVIVRLPLQLTTSEIDQMLGYAMATGRSFGNIEYSYCQAEAVGEGSGTVENAYREALLSSWQAVVETARWKHAQEAIASVVAV